jgi:ribosomal protein L18
LSDGYLTFQTSPLRPPEFGAYCSITFTVSEVKAKKRRVAWSRHCIIYSTDDKELRAGLKAPGGSCDASVAVGELVAKRAIAKGIQQVVFDRGGNLYHGRIKALADAAREAGLQF